MLASALLSAYCLRHEFSEPTCEQASTCSKCGETEGEPLGHTWKDPTCAEPQKCTICGIVEGEALGHDWKVADYENPKTCKVCGLQEGKPLEYIEPELYERTDEYVGMTSQEIAQQILDEFCAEHSQYGYEEVEIPGATPGRNEEISSRVPIQSASSVGVLASLVEGASLVSSYETWGAAAKTFHFGPPKSKASIREAPVTRACETALKKQIMQSRLIKSRASKEVNYQENLYKGGIIHGYKKESINNQSALNNYSWSGCRCDFVH